MKTIWTRLQSHPDYDFEYYRTYAELNPEFRPYVLCLQENGDIKTLLIGSIERRPIDLTFGYMVFPSPNFTVLRLSYKAIFGNTNELECSTLFDALFKLLHERKFDIISFRNLPLHSPFHDLAISKTPFSRRDHFRIKQETWQLTVPPSMDTYLSQHKNLRAYVKGYWANKLIKKYGTDISIIHYNSLDEVDTILNDTERIAERSWQRKAGGEWFLTNENRRKYEFYAKNNWLDVYILYIHGKPVCFSHGIKYNGVYFFRHMGYDPVYREYSVGSYLTVHMIKNVCNSKDIRIVDFGVGNSEAKRIFCDVCIDVENTHVFGPALNLKAFNLIRTPLTGAHIATKNLLKKGHLYQSLRKYFRQKGAR
ncbi:MAG: GNAT family N-acetyltransferase [Flavisolibacter sp.]